jgi:hypothetical protein
MRKDPPSVCYGSPAVSHCNAEADARGSALGDTTVTRDCCPRANDRPELSHMPGAMTNDQPSIAPKRTRSRLPVQDESLEHAG